MKIIVENETNIVKYALNDDVNINATEDAIFIGSPVVNTVIDLNSQNTTVYEDIDNVPSDFIGNKYLYDGSAWTANPNWSEPPTE